MKTAEEIVDAIGMYGVRDDWITALREYGAQVRDEAARGLEVIGDQHAGNDVCDDFVHILLPKLAAAIRKMELP